VALPTAVALVAELTPRTLRAQSILAIPGFGNCVGTCAVILLAIALLGFSDSTEAWQWRAMLMGGVGPNILGLLLVIMYVPESPRHLMVRKQEDQVCNVMVLIAHMNNCSEKLGGSWNKSTHARVLSNPFDTQTDTSGGRLFCQ